MTRAEARPEVPAAFLGFFDDAATFPPGLQPMEKAVRDHVARRENPLSPAVGPSVLSLADLPGARQIAAGIDLQGRPVEVSAVVPPGALAEALAAVRANGPALTVVALELKTDPETDPGANPEVREAAAAGMEVFVELATGQIRTGGLAYLAEAGLRLKYRTGGIEAHLFPSCAELAEVICAAVSAGVPFKLTAGLHEAVRYTNEATGFTHHGFLNIAAATSAARAGQAPDSVAALLEATDSGTLAGSVDPAGTWRDSFRSFGTCSVAEPADSLARIGLFPAGLA
ncbi:hypothetical protein [Arthrobacter koreensis]|uniref:hypothetical protein n=1 Tax=Arthrobacter koreensis TaxID=199136 RepID=UPI002DBAFDA1|nr:hypothetical protein [Arthrobacter koreensis]MEB7448195.1 hypothetical protein [Arthrobacter koreensis]